MKLSTSRQKFGLRDEDEHEDEKRRGEKREEIEEEEGEGGLHELARRRVEYLDDLLDSVF